jgi:peroxiredoxin Q/BCP
MAQLRQDYQKFLDRNAEIITIGPEDMESFKKWWHEHEMPFTGIPDPSHTISKSYGQKFKIIQGGRMPALSVIDIDGKIRNMHLGEGQSDIPTNEDVLAMLDTLNKETTAAEK